MLYLIPQSESGIRWLKAPIRMTIPEANDSHPRQSLKLLKTSALAPLFISEATRYRWYRLSLPLDGRLVRQCSLLGDSYSSPDAASVWLERTSGRLWTETDVVRVRNGERLFVQVFVWYDTIFGQSGSTFACSYHEGSALTSCGTENTIR